MSYQHDNRPVQELDWLSDSVPPLTAAAIDHIAQEATRILTDALRKLEMGRGKPC